MKRWHAIGIIVALLGLTTTGALYQQVLSLSVGASVSSVVAEDNVVVGETEARKVTALGRLEPQGGVIDVAPNVVGTSRILVS
ncbi:MAG: hypothetical protein AAFY72_11280, partial [Cyanobacteria bacterium J06649_4]